MKKNNKTIEEKLQEVRFLSLSEREAESAWQTVHARIEKEGVFSPLSVNKRKTMIPLLIGALLFASAGGTVAASNSATPGDVLFPLDRAVENVRVALARNEGKAELKLKFAEERLGEVEKLIAEARIKASATSTASTTASTKATSTATTTPKKVNDNVALGVNVAIAYLNDLSADLSASGNADAAARLEGVIDRLENIANDADVKVRLKSDDNFLLRLKGSNDNSKTSATSTATTSGEIRVNTSGNKDRIEVREDGGRIRIEIKSNGDVKIKSQSDNEDDDDKEEDEDDDRDNRGRGIKINSDLRLDLR